MKNNRALRVTGMLVAVVGLVVGGLAVATGATLPQGSDCAPPTDSSSMAQLREWQECRFDALEAKVDALATTDPEPQSTDAPEPQSTDDPEPEPTYDPEAWDCVTSETHGRCGPYEYAGVTGSTDQPNVDQNMWSPIPGETQTLYTNDPGDWKVVSNTPAGNTSVTAFPNTGAGFNETPVSAFSSIVSSFDVSVPEGEGVSGWAMYDLWFNSWQYEVMIQNDFVGNGPCTYEAVATFGGSDGVPEAEWGLCSWGDVMAWKLAEPGSQPGDSGTSNMPTGLVDLKAMIQWLSDNGYLPADPTITNLSYGFEICSTNGEDREFVVHDYELHATP